MGQSNFNPFTPFEVEVIETSESGRLRIYGVKDLTFKQAQEYHGRMNEDSKFQFYRSFPDESREPIDMNGYQMQFGIWKRGFIDTAGEYQPGALMEICDTEAEANDHLKFYESTKHYIEPY